MDWYQVGRLASSLTLEVLGDFLVPEGNVGFVVVDDWSKLGIPAEVGHKGVHSFKRMNEVDDAVLGRLLVEGARGIVDCLSQYGGKANTHRCVGEGIFMIATECGPRGVVRVDLERGDQSLG